MPQGACSARKRPTKDGQEENRFGTWSFTRMRTHMMKFSAPCPVVKMKHQNPISPASKHVFYSDFAIAQAG